MPQMTETCNFALLSFSPGPGAAATALSTTSWKNANAAAFEVLKHCVIDSGGGGAVAIDSGGWCLLYLPSLPCIHTNIGNSV